MRKRHIVVIKDTREELFEEAYFVLKSEGCGEKCRKNVTRGLSSAAEEVIDGVFGRGRRVRLCVPPVGYIGAAVLGGVATHILHLIF